jgi:molybdopterin converting factor small subunit
MKVLVQYTAQLRAAFGTAEEEIVLPDGGTLAALIVYLAGERCREAAPHLLTPAGDPQPSLLIALNKKAVPAREARTVTLHAADVVTLMPPIAGG